MDKTIEIIVVAMIALLVATILIFLVQGRSDTLETFLDGQQNNAQCELWKTQYERTGDESIKQKASECSGSGGWTSDASGSSGDSTGSTGGSESCEDDEYWNPTQERCVSEGTTSGL